MDNNGNTSSGSEPGSPLKLHEYQEHALNFVMANRNSALFMDMGLGKTAVSVRAIQSWLSSLRETHHGEDIKALVIAPIRVCENTWPAEIPKWSVGLTFSSLREIPFKRDFRKVISCRSDLHLINPESISSFLKESKKFQIENPEETFFPYRVLVIDESTAFKSSSSLRFKSLKPFLDYFRNILILSGTPVCNSLLNIWSQMYILDRGQRLEKSFYSFKKNYFYPDYSGYVWTPFPNSLKKITDKIQDISLSLTAKDNLPDLPEITYNNLYCSFDSILRLKYDKLEREFMVSLESQETVSACNAAVLSGKLVQFTSGSIYGDKEGVFDEYSSHYAPQIHSLKLQALEEIIELNPHKNVLVAYNYVHELRYATEYVCHELRLSYGNASCSRVQEASKAISDWNDGKIRVLFAHPRSVAHGLNLQTGGSIIVWLTLPWSLEHYLQFNSRLHRQGQKEKVVVNHILVRDTIDELMGERLRKKETDFSNFLRHLSIRRARRGLDITP